MVPFSSEAFAPAVTQQSIDYVGSMPKLRFRRLTGQKATSPTRWLYVASLAQTLYQ
jgi:hypothetical protein